jgi:hypothetical protein
MCQTCIINEPVYRRTETQVVERGGSWPDGVVSEEGVDEELEVWVVGELAPERLKGNVH